MGNRKSLRGRHLDIVLQVERYVQWPSFKTILNCFDEDD